MPDTPEDRRNSLFAHTGRSYFPLAFVARVPFAMVVVGVLTLLVSVRGSVGEAGVGSALVGIGAACFGPVIGAMADRYGQRPVLLASAALNSLLLGCLAWVAYAGSATPVVFATAFLVGSTVPQVSPMSRSRVVTITMTQLPVGRRPRVLSSVMAYESAADEVIFVFGPVLVGALAAGIGAWAPVVGAAVLTITFVVLFALHPTARLIEPAARTGEISTGSRQAPASELRRASLLVVIAGTLSVGLMFGSILTSLTSFLETEGRAEEAGLYYGVLGVGSAILAISAAWFSQRFTLRARWIVFGLCMFAGELVIATADSIGQITLGLAITGFGVGPCLVTLYSLAAERSPRGRSATVMTMVGSSLTLGQSLATALTGIIADGSGAAAALWMPPVAGFLVLTAGAVNLVLTSRTGDAGSLPAEPPDPAR